MLHTRAYGDNGKEAGNHPYGVYMYIYIYTHLNIGIKERSMETAILLQCIYRGNVRRMEKNMETTILSWRVCMYIYIYIFIGIM